jgi:hypothetical protein
VTHRIKNDDLEAVHGLVEVMMGDLPKFKLDRALEERAWAALVQAKQELALANPDRTVLAHAITASAGPFQRVSPGAWAAMLTTAAEVCNGKIPH